MARTFIISRKGKCSQRNLLHTLWQNSDQLPPLNSKEYVLATLWIRRRGGMQRPPREAGGPYSQDRVGNTLPTWSRKTSPSSVTFPSQVQLTAQATAPCPAPQNGQMKAQATGKSLIEVKSLRIRHQHQAQGTLCQCWKPPLSLPLAREISLRITSQHHQQPRLSPACPVLPLPPNPTHPRNN